METAKLERSDLVSATSKTAAASGNGTACAGEATSYAPPASFPADAKATIYRPARSSMTSAQAATRHWVLEFEPRSPLFIEPLMGWTGGADPLQQVALLFPSKEAAIAYAQRQRLPFDVREPNESRCPRRTYADNFSSASLHRTQDEPLKGAAGRSDPDKDSPPTRPTAAAARHGLAA